jgi:thiamine-monophosphate kinase
MLDFIMRLHDVGELEVIEFIKKLTSSLQNPDVKLGIGDDASVLKNGTIITTDAYFEDRHFSLDYFTLKDIGHKVTSATLSDIAAMAGKPIALYVALLIPRFWNKKSLYLLYRGIKEVARKFNVTIGGGDLVGNSKLGIMLTAIGKASCPKLRSSAQVGDYLYLTGYCGLSETGRLALKNRLPRNIFRQAIRHHLKPLPRIDEALKLKNKIHALIDTSDGLSTDAYHLAEESKVKIKIYAEKLPIHPETLRLSKYLKVFAYSNATLNLALNGGEDYELLFSSPQKNLPSLIGRTKLTLIGKIEKGQGLYLVRNNREEAIAPRGYDQFRD